MITLTFTLNHHCLQEPWHTTRQDAADSSDDEGSMQNAQLTINEHYVKALECRKEGEELVVAKCTFVHPSSPSPLSFSSSFFFRSCSLPPA